ncbi:MAG: 3-hydroxyacyl-ACP dehydratase FabZ [Bacteroidales bacterium]|nr:3-hydroxyacyl-ACP dehydratase FabZ [Bacteroidales bacterium]
MNKEEIKKLLPHREPMLLVDEMYLENGESISKYTIKGDEHFLNGHFPGMPVVPGVILCEIMAQGSSILVADKLDGSVVPMYVGLNDVRFKQPVLPGDTVETHAKLANIRGNIIFTDATAYVNGKVCCSGKLTVALTPKK